MCITRTNTGCLYQMIFDNLNEINSYLVLDKEVVCFRSKDDVTRWKQDY